MALLTSCSRSEPRIAVRDAWARETVVGQTTAVAYLRMENQGSGGDRLVGVSSPAARSASLHASSNEGGVARMRAVRELAIPAGQAVDLKPGGYHVMLVGLGGPMRAGASIPVSLRFERSGMIDARVQVRSAAAANDGGHSREAH